MTKAGIIGVGAIGSAVAERLARNGFEVLISRRNKGNSGRLEAEFPQVRVAENQAVVDGADVVFIALPADVAADAISALNFREGQVVVSLMAAIDLSEAQKWTTPAKTQTLMLPFPQITKGASPILVLGDAAPVQGFFGKSESITQIENPKEMQAFMCVQAILSPSAVLVDEAARWLGAQGFDAEKAEGFLRSLIASSYTAMPSGALIEALNTEGGYNQRLRKFFEARGVVEVLKDGLEDLKGGG